MTETDSLLDIELIKKKPIAGVVTFTLRNPSLSSNISPS